MIILKCIFVKCVMVFYSYLSFGGYLGYINERTVGVYVGCGEQEMNTFLWKRVIA